MTMPQRFHSSLIILSGLALVLASLAVYDGTSVVTLQRVGEVGAMASGLLMVVAGLLQWWWDEYD